MLLKVGKVPEISANLQTYQWLYQGVFKTAGRLEGSNLLMLSSLPF